MFKIGQKVVCVNDKRHNLKLAGMLPIKKGEIYTIIDIKECSCGEVKLDVGLKAEIVRSKCWCGIVDFGYWNNSRRFRPITESENFATDVIEKLEEQFNEELITI